MRDFNRSYSAFTLIEAMTLLFVFSLMALTFYSLFGLGAKYILESKNRLEALSLASEKMEAMRSMPYANVGVLGGIPNGVLKEKEELTRSNHKFIVHNFVQYIDDPLDGLAPDDVLPNDYKRVKVTVSWNDSNGYRETALVSRFVPPGLETSAGGGLLSINIVNSLGQSVGQASLEIKNSSISPSINFSTKTDLTGNLTLPAAMPSIQGYQITATKNGYESVTTVDPASLDYVPTDSHATVVADSINTKTIVIDELANIKIVSEEIDGTPVANSDFSLIGGRVLGTYSDGKKVYGINEKTQTGSDGQKEFLAISPGVFNYINESQPDGLTWVRTIPNLTNLEIKPGESRIIRSQFIKDNQEVLKIKVIKNEEGTPIVGAQVSLSGDSDFQETQETDEQGLVFFPDVSDQLLVVGNSYQIIVKADGFQDYSGEVSIDHLINDKEISLAVK